MLIPFCICCICTGCIFFLSILLLRYITINKHICIDVCMCVPVCISIYIYHTPHTCSHIYILEVNRLIHKYLQNNDVNIFIKCYQVLAANHNDMLCYSH